MRTIPLAHTSRQCELVWISKLPSDFSLYQLQNQICINFRHLRRIFRDWSIVHVFEVESCLLREIDNWLTLEEKIWMKFEDNCVCFFTSSFYIFTIRRQSFSNKFLQFISLRSIQVLLNDIHFYDTIIITTIRIKITLFSIRVICNKYV